MRIYFVLSVLFLFVTSAKATHFFWYGWEGYYEYPVNVGTPSATWLKINLKRGDLVPNEFPERTEGVFDHFMVDSKGNRKAPITQFNPDETDEQRTKREMRLFQLLLRNIAMFEKSLLQAALQGEIKKIQGYDDQEAVAAQFPVVPQFPKESLLESYFSGLAYNSSFVDTASIDPDNPNQEDRIPQITEAKQQVSDLILRMSEPLRALLLVIGIENDSRAKPVKSSPNNEPNNKDLRTLLKNLGHQKFTELMSDPVGFLILYAAGGLRGTQLKKRSIEIMGRKDHSLLLDLVDIIRSSRGNKFQELVVELAKYIHVEPWMLRARIDELLDLAHEFPKLTSLPKSRSAESIFNELFGPRCLSR